MEIRLKKVLNLKLLYKYVIPGMGDKVDKVSMEGYSSITEAAAFLITLEAKSSPPNPLYGLFTR